MVCTFSVPCLYPVFIQRRLRTFWIQTCLKFKCDDITSAFFRWERKMENLFCVIFKKWMSLPFVGYLTKKELHILGVPPQIRTKTLANLGQNSNWFGLTNALGKPSRKKSAFFFNIVQKAFDPPPFYLNICPILQGVFFNVFWNGYEIYVAPHI